MNNLNDEQKKLINYVKKQYGLTEAQVSVCSNPDFSINRLSAIMLGFIAYLLTIDEINNCNELATDDDSFNDLITELIKNKKGVRW